jgi:HK97 family phage prohead protease
MKPQIPTPASERRDFAAELELRVRAGMDSPGRLIGHAAIFDAVADLGRYREKIARGAFKDSIAKDDIRALINHDPQYLLGRNKSKTLSLSEDTEGLRVEIDLPNTSAARNLVESIKRGDVSQMSFGFTAIDDSWEKDSAGATVRTLRKVKLYDVSPVTFPAYPQTDIKAVHIAHDGGRIRNTGLGRLRLRLELEAI